MSDNPYHSYEIQSCILYKFGSLISAKPGDVDRANSIDITLQVMELNLYQNLFEPVIRAEIAVQDPVGLIVNFPISGEEALYIKWKSIPDDQEREVYLIVDSVSHITASDDARTTAYLINCVSLEAYANAKQTVQQAYNDNIPNIAKQVYQEHIQQRMQRVFPQYRSLNLIVENNDTQAQTVIIPNIRPFQALAMLGEMAVNEVDPYKSTYLVYQRFDSYNFRTLQGLFDSRTGAARRRATDNKYIYHAQITDELREQYEGRVVSNLVVNKRVSSFSKLGLGYYHNNLFEINIAQKSVWCEPTVTDDVLTIYTNKLNTEVYSQLAIVETDDQERSNRTKYMITTNKESDPQYPVSRYRDKWGRDLISTIAMGQVDLNIAIPGTVQFDLGDLFHLEVPEMHGFNEVKQDDLISGLFVITEIKYLLAPGGFYTTVLRINKDSYLSTIDRPSRYAD